MKALHRPGTPVPQQYPYLGLHRDGTIVYFYENSAGVALIGYGSTRAGDWGPDWDEGDFVRMSGDVVLSND